ncbi:MAG: hypothetical protein COX07_06580 [Bacteroidetes bacterium CG23_combo_of_CG06-09_8_20_14_all_32_9]|nr:MAG: hypothetical protein COX07_06580 [Bacteroidetes bacterium CG23_combo_of_CG06-09_8_20_14_all_32_9]
MKKIKLFSTIVVSVLFSLQLSFALTQSEIEKANRAGKAVFLVVNDNFTKTADIMPTVNEAAKELKNISVFEVNRSDVKSKEIIEKYKLSTIPVPAVITISQSGVVASALYNPNITKENLKNSVPSPKQSDMLKKLSNGKAVLLVISDKNFTDRKAFMDECNKCITESNGKAEIVEVKISDKAEQSLIKKLAIDPKTTASRVIVYNSKGQLNGVFGADVSSSELGVAINKVAGGCCPGKKKCGSK